MPLFWQKEVSAKGYAGYVFSRVPSEYVLLAPFMDVIFLPFLVYVDVIFLPFPVYVLAVKNALASKWCSHPWLSFCVVFLV